VYRDSVLQLIPHSSGVAPGQYSVEALLDELYQANPGAVINGIYVSFKRGTRPDPCIDRFGDTHWDFRTVEYGLGPTPEEGAMWQFTRGSTLQDLIFEALNN